MLCCICQIENIALDVIVDVMYLEKSRKINTNAIVVKKFGLGKNENRSS